MDFLSKINGERNETNIKDVKLRNKLEPLLNNICLQRLESNKYTFIKYFASKRKGILYCLLLSGDQLDGIYEFKVFGHNLNFENILSEYGVVTKINTTSNYDLAEFDMKDVLTVVKKHTDFQFRNDINTFSRKLISFDMVFLKTKDKTIEFNQSFLGEIKFKREIRRAIDLYSNDLLSIEGLEKKKKLYISSIDLGKDEFRKQIIDLGLVTKEEYELYTKFNDELFEKNKEKFKLVEVIF